jgi:1-acyl-sn-glycerol-3-phosphate acyltransferase
MFVFSIIFIILVLPLAYLGSIIPLARTIGILIGKAYMRGILWCYGIWWIRIKGRMDPKTRQITYNHTAVPDGILLFCIHTCTFTMMASVKGVPAFGKMMEALGSVFIDRTRQDGNSSLISDAIRDHSRQPLAVAPEAKLSNGTVVFRFRTGAFLTNEQIQPIAFRYYRLLPAFGGGLGWFVDSFWEYLWTVFCSPGFIAEATWLDPIRSEVLEGKTPQDRADLTQLALANYFGTLAVDKSTKEFFAQQSGETKQSEKEKKE